MDSKILLSKQKLKAVFNKLDLDKNGYIDVLEIKHMFKYHKLSEKQI